MTYNCKIEEESFEEKNKRNVREAKITGMEDIVITLIAGGTGIILIITTIIMIVYIIGGIIGSI